MALTIAVPRFPVYMEQGKSGNLEGAIGSAIQNMHRSVFGNVSFVVSTNDGDTLIQDEAISSGQKSNGSTFTHMFMKNKADMTGIPLEYGMDSAYLVPTCPVANMAGAALHAPLLSHTNQNVLNTLEVYPSEVIGSIFWSIITLGLFLKVTRKFSFINSILSLGKCLINQVHLNSRQIRCKALFMFWLLCSFAIMAIFQQAINADMISLDFGSVVESASDLDHHKSYQAVFLQGEYIREQFKRSQDSLKKRIWNRKNTRIQEFNMESGLGLAAAKNDTVFIGASVALISVGQYACGINKAKGNTERPKFLIGSKDFGSANIGFYYRANVVEKVKQLIWHKNLLVGEAGYSYYMAKKCSKPATDFSPDSTPACLCYNKEDLYDNVEKLLPIKINNVSSLMGVLSLLWIFSCVLFIVERTFYGVQVLRHRSVHTCNVLMPS